MQLVSLHLATCLLELRYFEGWHKSRPDPSDGVGAQRRQCLAYVMFGPRESQPAVVRGLAGSPEEANSRKAYLPGPQRPRQAGL